MAPSPAHTKYEAVLAALRPLEGAVVAFSGGVDSSLLLAAARDALGDRVLAVTGLSPSYARAEWEDAQRVAKQLGVRLETVETDEMADPNYADNPQDRCFHCKTHLFRLLRELAAREEYAAVLEGSNADDLSDYRPGMQASARLGVISPLKDAGLTKAEIRELLREKKLPVWDKPAQACLASRVPYGQPITPEKLARIEAAEAALRGLGFPVVRVRDWGFLAVVEVAPGDRERLFTATVRAQVEGALHAAGYARVALDTGGYQTGSLNAVVDIHRSSS